MADVKVIFSRTTKWWDVFSYLVRLITWSNWSHVAILIDDNTVIESTAMKNGNPTNGVHFSTLEDFKSRATTWEIRSFEVDNPDAIITAAKAKVGTKYNFKSQIGMLLHIGSWQNSACTYCSEFVTDIFCVGGSPKFNEKFKARIAPQHWYMLYSTFVDSSNK